MPSRSCMMLWMMRYMFLWHLLASLAAALNTGVHEPSFPQHIPSHLWRASLSRPRSPHKTSPASAVSALELTGDVGSIPKWGPAREGSPSPSSRGGSICGLRLVASRTAMAAPSPSPEEAAPPLEAAAAAAAVEEEDEWDADGYVIPNLPTQDNDVTEPSVPKEKDPEPLQEKDEKIYLGPHGAPPSQAKHQELNTVGRKQRFRNKLKEADRKFIGNAQENKVESLRELMGARGGTSMPKSSPRDWLNPHCHESEFD